MVSPVRIRVPPLIKALQIAEKYGHLTELPKPFFEACQQPDRERSLLVRLSRSLACHLWAGVDGEGHPVMGVI
jgi:hypothetical protein